MRWEICKVGDMRCYMRTTQVSTRDPVGPRSPRSVKLPCSSCCAVWLLEVRIDMQLFAIVSYRYLLSLSDTLSRLAKRKTGPVRSAQRGGLECWRMRRLVYLALYCTSSGKAQPGLSFFR